MGRAATLAVAGATLGTLLDLVHVRTGTTAYTTPAFLGLAWWVPFLFAAAGVAIGLSHPWLDPVLGRRAPLPETGARVTAGMTALLGLWALSGLLGGPPRAVGLVLAPGSLALWWMLDRSVPGLLQALATAVVGVGVEMGLVRAGVFRYVHPDMAGVASWLPWLYVAASVAVGNLGRWLARERPVRVAAAVRA